MSQFVAYFACLLAIILSLTFAFRYEDRIIGLGTIALAIATAFLAWEAHQQTILTNEALTSVQRAFVVFKDITYGKLPDYLAADPTGIRFIVAWENTGTTPTKFLVTHVSWSVFTPDIPINYDFPDLGRRANSRALIGPKSSMNMAAVDIPIADFRAVQAGAYRLYMWGWADYNDIFQGTQRHRTEFCAEILVTGSLSDTIPGLTFVAFTKYNGADGETMKKPNPYPLSS